MRAIESSPPMAITLTERQYDEAVAVGTRIGQSNAAAGRDPRLGRETRKQADALPDDIMATCGEYALSVLTGLSRYEGTRP